MRSKMILGLRQGKYVREEKVITLEEAIRRMTSLPAQKFQLTDRGLLKEGMAADIVIFDEKEVKDMATFEKPHAYSKGFHYVIVNGVITAENEKHLGVRAGKALYHSDKQYFSFGQLYNPSICLLHKWVIPVVATYE